MANVVGVDVERDVLAAHLQAGGAEPARGDRGLRSSPRTAEPSPRRDREAAVLSQPFEDAAWAVVGSQQGGDERAAHESGSVVGPCRGDTPSARYVTLLDHGPGIVRPHEPLRPRPRRPGAARDDARAVLRPRVRLRDHAGLAPPARAPDLGGRRAGALVLLVVWWSWNYTTWVTNELDPDSIAVRLLLIGLMLASPPDGGRDPGGVRGPRAAVRGRLRGDPGRPAHVPDLRRRRAGDDRARARARRILIWFVAAGVLWIAGGLADGPGAHAAVADRAGDRLRRARCSPSGCPGCRRSRRRPGSSRSRTSPSASSCS